METQVDSSRVEDHSEVAHETRLSKCCITVLSSRETFLLEPDGQNVRVHGLRRTFPCRSHDFGDSHATVALDARSVLYSFPWFGTRIKQTVTLIDSDHGIMSMQTEWIRGEVKLFRVTENSNCQSVPAKWFARHPFRRAKL